MQKSVLDGFSLDSSLVRSPPTSHQGLHEALEGGTLSRRRFIGTAAGAAGLAVTSGLWASALADVSRGAQPRPIPGGTTIPGLGFFHFFFPGPGNEPALITDFRGKVGVADLTGTGMGTDPATGATVSLLYGADMRFMKGHYVGKNNQVHQGTLVFI